MDMINSLISLSLTTGPLTVEAPYTSETTLASTETASSRRASLRRMNGLLAPTPQLEPMGANVGELQEAWQFPSDHLPIGLTYNGLHMASWNVLDSEYMEWVTEKNSQGLNRSLIVTENVPIDVSGLTLREAHVIELILSMLAHETHPKSLLSLQECGEPFLTALKASLPPSYKIVSYGECAVLFDERLFELQDAQAVVGVYSFSPERPFEEVFLKQKETGEKLRIVNAHVPGDPLQPCRFEFADYLRRTQDPSVTTLAMGDMNFNELEMREALDPSFSLYSPYCTNIAPFTYRSKAIDHFMISSPQGRIELLTPEQVMTGLNPMVDLLQPIPH